MKPFQPNKEQLEAIRNGATKLWMPIKGWPLASIKSNLLVHGNKVGSIYSAQSFSPLQPGESYFVQECVACDKLSGDYLYANDLIYVPIKWVQSANQMTETQSKHKFTVTDVEVKQVQDLNMKENARVLGFNQIEFLGDIIISTAFKKFIDSQYLEQPYSSNPCGFLITIKEIK